MKVRKHRKLKQHYNKCGVDETIKFILYSEEEKYLIATEDISKVLELASLKKGQRSIVKFLNYLEDNKGTIMPSFSNNYNSIINGAKMSPRQLRYMKERINNLTQNELTFYKSFVGVLELDQDDLRLARVKVKEAKIRALYTAIIPLCNIDFLKVVEALEFKGVKSSEQDIIAFLSLIIGLSFDGVNVNIFASIWESIFGRGLIKVAKKVFQDLGILKLVSKPITGFKSAGYEINLIDTLYSLEEPRSINMEITSIRTLEKLNRIKRYKGNFTLNEKTKALKLIIDLRLKDMRMSGKINLTNIFLESGKIQVLINDLDRMKDILNDDRFYAFTKSLGIHLTAYSNGIKRDNFKAYIPFYEKSSS